MANKVLDKGRSEQKCILQSGRERKRALLNHLQGNLERLERRLRAGLHVGPAAHSVESSPIAVGRGTTPLSSGRPGEGRGCLSCPFPISCSWRESEEENASQRPQATLSLGLPESEGRAINEDSSICVCKLPIMGRLIYSHHLQLNLKVD